MKSPSWIGAGGPRLVDRPAHRRWLLAEAERLVSFFQRGALNPAGGFFALGEDEHPLPQSDGARRKLHDTTRMVHCFAVGHLLGWPGADRMVDHGMAFLLEGGHRDPRHGGWFWEVGDDGPTDPAKQAYGHAFVILAASSALVVGHPDACALLDDATGVLLDRFWDDAAGAATEEYAADWGPLDASGRPYRGQNSNMHLTEALMAAHEATGEMRWLDMAGRIARLVIDRHGRAEGWRVPEHFTADWMVDRAYAGDPMFRPAGTTPGHALEWSRLLVQLWELGARREAWLPQAARALFLCAVETGWDRDRGGFHYTLGWDSRPDQADRFWWPCAEGIGAAAVLAAVEPDPRAPSPFEAWYRRIWDFTATHLVDHDGGGWFPELGPDLRPAPRVFVGRPDLYHALQACLIPLLPTTGSVTRGLSDGGRGLLG